MDIIKMLNRYFVTGTDTSIGKTLVSAMLTYVLKATYWKPINTGDLDRQRVKELTGLPEKHFLKPIYQFTQPLSPDQAAYKENQTIDIQRCDLPTNINSLIVEGAGGIYAPLNNHHRIVDLMAKFNLSTIVVTRGTLGTINHTLLTIETLLNRGIKIKGIIFSGELNPDNQIAIEKWTGVKTLFHLPLLTDLSQSSFTQWVTTQEENILENLV